MISLERDVGHLFTYFKFKIAEAQKPDPSIFLSTLDQYKIDPRSTIYVGDAVSDIVMAKKVSSLHL